MTRMRVASLVPSLTEAVAVTLPGLLVGATDWCTHPADLDVPRVGGSKYPDLDKVIALAPNWGTCWPSWVRSANPNGCASPVPNGQR